MRWENIDFTTRTAACQGSTETHHWTGRTVLTDNGIQFVDLPKNRQGPTALFRGHPFDRTCHIHEIVKEATVKRFLLRHARS
jgi:hypothetical protein